MVPGRRYLLLLFVLSLTACSPDPGSSIPSQTWHDFNVMLETRPEPVKTGMNEFLVIATLPSGLPVSDMIVSLRTSDQDPWRQAIQDGHTGVYRTALLIRAGETTVTVQLRQKDTEGLLVYQLRPAAGQS